MYLIWIECNINNEFGLPDQYNFNKKEIYASTSNLIKALFYFIRANTKNYSRITLEYYEENLH
jgi:hypothetical protein